MELAKLYDIADKENISIINFKMKNKAIIGKVDKFYCIGLNYSKIDDFREEKGCQYSYQIAEELGVSEELVNTVYAYYKENNYI